MLARTRGQSAIVVVIYSLLLVVVSPHAPLHGGPWPQFGHGNYDGGATTSSATAGTVGWIQARAVCSVENAGRLPRTVVEKRGVGSVMEILSYEIPVLQLRGGSGVDTDSDADDEDDDDEESDSGDGSESPNTAHPGAYGGGEVEDSYVSRFCCA